MRVPLIRGFPRRISGSLTMCCFHGTVMRRYYRLSPAMAKAGSASRAGGKPLKQCGVENFCFRKLLEQIGLVAEDAAKHRLKLEPSRHRASDLLPRRNRGGRIDLYRRAGRLGQQLCLATAVHGDEPPRRFLDALADGEQSVIPQNRRFVLPESLRDARALRRLVHHARKVREQSVVLVKRARILRDGIEQPS